MKRYGMIACFCASTQLLYAPNKIERDKIKQELADELKKCELGKELHIPVLVPAVTCLCQTFPLKVIAHCKAVCIANEQLEQEVKNIAEQQQKEFLEFINQYVAVEPTDGIPQALQALKGPLAAEGKYTRKTVYTARVCDAVMRAINLAAALKENELAQLETLVGQVGVKDKNYSSLYLLQLDAAPNPIIALAELRSFATIIGSIDLVKNPLSTYFGATKIFFEKATVDIRTWQEGPTISEDDKAVLARKKKALIALKDLTIPELPENVAIKGQR